MISLKEFLALTTAERWIYFEKAAATKGVPVHLIEKDFWVTFLLHQLFSLRNIGPVFTFKGGTSLSKVFGLIERVSEDIDISIEKAFLGFGDEMLPERAASRKKREHLIEALSIACREFIEQRLHPELADGIGAMLPNATGWQIEMSEEDPDRQTLLFIYPTSASALKGYVHPVVKMEFGSRGEHWPVEQHEISSYVQKYLPDEFEGWGARIRVLSPVRTFWEKATILHMYANLPEAKGIPARQSRHFYDLHCLLHSAVKEKALQELKLLEDVCDHKAIYFRSAAAKYEEAKEGVLKLIPATRVLADMRADYGEMAEMIYGEPIAWESIIESLTAFQAELKMIRANRVVT